MSLIAKIFRLSLVPLLVTELACERDRPSLFDQFFGLPVGVLPYELSPLHSGYLRPWRILDEHHSGVSKVHIDKDGFNVYLDVQQFKPEELTVKVDRGFVVVEGKHEERSDEHGYVSRQFTRRYSLPEGVDEEKLSSSLSSDGVLQLHAPKLPGERAHERIVPIKQTDQPAKATTKEQKGHEKTAEEGKANERDIPIKQTHHPAVEQNAAAGEPEKVQEHMAAGEHKAAEQPKKEDRREKMES